MLQRLLDNGQRGSSMSQPLGCNAADERAGIHGRDDAKPVRASVSGP